MLREFPTAFIHILQYVLVPLVGRRVEAVHAQIKRLGASARNVLPPYISSRLFLETGLSMLEELPGSTPAPWLAEVPRASLRVLGL